MQGLGFSVLLGRISGRLETCSCSGTEIANLMEVEGQKPQIWVLCQVTGYNMSQIFHVDVLDARKAIVRALQMNRIFN